MSFSVGTTFQSGDVEVISTSGRGFNPDELTAMLLPKIVYIGSDVPESVREQAEAGKARIEALLKHYLAQAQKSERTTVFNVLMNAGYPEAAQLVKEL